MSNTMKVGIVSLEKMGILHAGIVNSISDATVTAICEKESFVSCGQGILAEENLDLQGSSEDDGRGAA
jgi:hypothetical protein